MSRPHSQQAAFSLIVLLVVLAIIALLMGILLPALAAARHAAVSTKCLVNLRNMEVAHWAYMTDHDGHFIDAGLPHGGTDKNEELAWINTLSAYYGTPLAHRSPLDDSPYWPVDQGGQGLTVAGEVRRTSYGVNNYLTGKGPNPAYPYDGLDTLASPSGTVHFLIMAYGTGASEAADAYATADHPHVESWWNPVYSGVAYGTAAKQVQIDVHGGPPASPDSRSAWGFLDGHAERLPFSQVYHSNAKNAFDPAAAK